MFVGWFGTVIRESEGRFYNAAVDRSFRMGMMWFIFSEVMFFAAFFGALLYARQYSVPWLGGEGDKVLTNAAGRSSKPLADQRPRLTSAARSESSRRRPAGINTAILLTSGVTVPSRITR